PVRTGHRFRLADDSPPATQLRRWEVLMLTPHPPRVGALSSDDGADRANAPELRLPLRERIPWRPVGTSIATLGIPVCLAVVNPTLAGASAVTELVVALVIIATALFGSSILSERAFRLLRWIGNRPEPPAPHAVQQEAALSVQGPQGGGLH